MTESGQPPPGPWSDNGYEDHTQVRPPGAPAAKPQADPEAPNRPRQQQPPPTPPHGQPIHPFGQPQPPPPAQPVPPAYGAPPAQPAPGYGAPAAGHASWGNRVVATLWDLLYLWPGWVAYFVGFILLAIGAGLASGGNEGLGAALLVIGGLALLAGVVLLIWRYITNYMLDQGRTGYTYGKRKVGIRTIREDTRQPAGVGSCVGRYFLHGLIAQFFYIDYLWPLWDEKNQTITDKILGTVVIRLPQ